jgi:putative tryptophan/tyrosine transport system substrate-binding protein
MAKQKAAPTRTLGFLNSASAKELKTPVAAFHSGMNSVGFTEGKNVKVVNLWAKHDLARLPALARKLVEQGVDVLAATGGIAVAQAAVAAAKGATKPIRVVFVAGFDPSRVDLVNDVKRPSGNATGVNTSTTEVLPKRLQLAKTLLPGKPLAMLVKPGTVLGQLEAQRADGASVLEASTGAELKAKFAEAKAKGWAVVVGADAFFTSNRKQIVDLAKRHAVPAIYPFREYVDVGGLMSYGPNLSNAYRQAGVYVGKILDDPSWVNPAILEPAFLELAINLKTARALELDVPHQLLTQASHVI